MILPLPPTQIFKVVETTKAAERVHLVLEATWPPGSSEFAGGVSRLVERLTPVCDLFLMVFPEEGDAPLTRNSHARTMRSFADGRWFSELEPRAEVVELAKNPALSGLVFFQDEGLVLATRHEIGMRAWGLARILDRAPDLGTTAHVLEHVEFMAYALGDRFHVHGADADRMAWLKKQLP